MGTQFLIGTRTMKFLVVLALVAAAYAEPEAEANAEAEPWWYSNYGYASPYYSGYRYGYSPYYNWGGYRYLWKREAEAEPKADAEAEPWWYSHYGYGYRGYASPYWNRWGYAYSPYYNWGGYRYLWKRDAEAQPEAEANPEAYWYGNWYGRRWGGWGYGYRPYGYGYYGRRWGWETHPPYSLIVIHIPSPFEFNVQFYPVAYPHGNFSL